jgi:poly(3-hydroxybutyrate) depolymerase
MDALAERAGFIVVYPNGTGRLDEKLLTWNAGLCCGYAMTEKVDDVGFVRALLDALATRAPVDTARVYATGLSNGAMLSYRLAAQLSDRIAAVAPVAPDGAARAPGRRRRPRSRCRASARADPPHPQHRRKRLPLRRPRRPFPFTNVRTRHPNAEEVLYRWVTSRVRAEAGRARRAHGTATTASHRDAVRSPAAATAARSGAVKATGAGHVWPGARRDYLRGCWVPALTSSTPTRRCEVLSDCCRRPGS